MNYLDERSKSEPGNASAPRFSRRLNDRKKDAQLRVLSEENWQHWKSKGYVVISNAVPENQVDQTVATLWEFQEMDPEDPATWYRNPANPMEMTELIGSGMVEIYNHQDLWINRQYPRVYDAFVDVWGTTKLWVTIDRANINPPNREGHAYPGFIHWDIDTSLVPKPVNVQGVLALNDQTDESMGGFQCIPKLYAEFDEWVKTQPKDRDPFQPDITGFTIEKVKLKKGDLLIWDSMLAHGIRPNNSSKPRLAQYISMVPAEEDNESLRSWRIKSWRERIAPEGYAFPGDPRKWEQTKYPVAELSELGEKLLGLTKW